MPKIQANGMKRKRVQRIFMAWLLLATILPIVVVKSVHHHNAVHTSTELAIHSLYMEHSVHFTTADNACPICHFIVSPYTEVKTYEFHSFVPYIPFERPIVHEQEKKSRFIYSHGLRAPPVSLCIA